MDTLHGDVFNLGVNMAGNPRSIGHGADDMVGDLSFHRRRDRDVHLGPCDASAAQN